MADSQRSTPQSTSPIDPRLAVAEEYLQSAPRKLAEQEEAELGSRRGVAVSIALVTFVHLVQAAPALTAAFLAITLTYHMLNVNLTVGRVVALPTGFITAAMLGYLSVCYLGLIESTANGHTNIDLSDGDWKEWFWTLPTTLGMFAISAALGWLVSLVLPVNVWWLIAIASFITYPIFQLSSLETGSPTAPLSRPVLHSIVKHPLAWLAMYGMALAIFYAVWLVLRSAWRDPPYVTMLVWGPVVAVALFFYAWLLGQLANVITQPEET